MLRMNEAHTPTLLMIHSLSSAQPLHPTERASPLVYQPSKEQCSTGPYKEVAENTCSDGRAYIFESKPLPFPILTDSLERVWRWSFHERPEHYGCCGR